MRLSFRVVLGGVLTLTASLLGCGHATEDEKPVVNGDAKPILLARAALAADEGGWGTIKGQIVFGGEAPVPKEITITKDEKDCKDALKGAPLVNEEWVVEKDNKGVRWVYVWIAPTDPKGKLAIHPDLAAIKDPKVVMDQPCCHFEPHCLAVREGQIWVAKNSALIPHNVKWEGGSKNQGDNPILPAGKEVEIKDLKAELSPITVACSIHPWMKAWVRVFDHPYYTITDKDGKFEIKNAPAGDCLLYIWHEGAGWVHQGGKKGQPITIKAGESLDLGKVEAKPS
jgi:hypothetical protein